MTTGENQPPEEHQGDTPKFPQDANDPAILGDTPADAARDPGDRPDDTNAPPAPAENKGPSVPESEKALGESPLNTPIGRWIENNLSEVVRSGRAAFVSKSSEEDTQEPGGETSSEFPDESSRPLLEEGSLPTGGRPGRAAEQFLTSSFTMGREILKTERHLVLIGRNANFGSGNGLLNVAAHAILQSMKNESSLGQFTWWRVVEHRVATVEALTQSLSTLKYGYHLIWWTRQYEQRGRTWIPHLDENDRRTLRDHLERKAAWLIEIVDVPLGNRLRFGDYSQYSDHVVYVPWHDFWLNEVFGASSDPESYRHLQPLISEAAGQSEYELRLYAALKERTAELRDINVRNDNELRKLQELVKQIIEASKRDSDVNDLLCRHMGTVAFKKPADAPPATASPIGIPIVISQTMLVVAAFAPGISVAVYDRLCHALLPNLPVPQALLPPFLSAGSGQTIRPDDAQKKSAADGSHERSPSRTWTWPELWTWVGDDMRHELHITVTPDSRTIHLSTAQWGELGPLRTVISTRFASIWSQITSRALQILPTLDAQELRAALILVLTGAENEVDRTDLLERRVAHILASLVKPATSASTPSKLTPATRFRIGLSVLLGSGLSSIDAKRVYNQLVTAADDLSTHEILTTELVANGRTLGLPIEKFGDLLRAFFSRELYADRKQTLMKGIARDRRRSERRWLWMLSFVPWLDSNTSTLEQRTLGHLIWEQCIFSDFWLGRDSSYDEMETRNTIGFHLHKGTESEARSFVDAFLKLRTDVWLNASQNSSSIFLSVLYTLRHGPKEAQIANNPRLDIALTTIFIEEMLRRTNINVSDIGAALKQLVNGHGGMFRIFKAALLVEWRFQVYGAGTDALLEADKQRIRDILVWVRASSTDEQRIQLASDWEALMRISEKYAKLATDYGDQQLATIYLQKRDRLHRMVELLLKAN
jgi:hypothetical protein